MRSRRYLAFLTSLAFVACSGGDAGEAEAGGGDEMAQAESGTDDAAAIQGLADYYETHYNMGHASMVADVFDAEDAGGLWADGTISEGKEGILAYLESQMAGNPTLDLTHMDEMVFGDMAVGHGSWSVETTPEGAPAPMNMSGHWLAAYNNTADGWKLAWVVSNYGHDWPEGMPAGGSPTDPPPENGTMVDLISGYETHWNMGHPDMVADFYTEDAIAAFQFQAPATGREAIAGVLAARMDPAPTTLDIHDVNTMELAEGWALDGGWYEIMPADGGDPVQSGTYMALVRQADDGSWQLHWAVTNGVPAEVAGAM